VHHVLFCREIYDGLIAGVEGTGVKLGEKAPGRMVWLPEEDWGGSVVGGRGGHGLLAGVNWEGMGKCG